MLTTGRMPLNDPADNPVRKDPAYRPAEIAALVAYVASLGDGPPIPDVDIAAGNLAVGGVLYRENCQACHSATGAGGALSYGRAAPSLSKATPTQVGAAIRTGPGQMPVFGPETLSKRAGRLDRPVRAATSRNPTTGAASRSAGSARSPRASWSGCSASGCSW